MAEIELRNETELKFTDISSEEFRTYTFGNSLAKGGRISDEYATTTIHGPQHLNVSRGGHRILDKDGISHYVPKGWLHLSWKAKDGEPHFVK